MIHLIIDLILIFLLVLIGGIFVSTEFAFVSLRSSQIDQLEERSQKGKRVASIARNPNLFLSSTQIGVTFVGLFSASLGAEVLSPYLEPYMPRGWAIVILTVIIAYLSLVFGEMVPKQFAISKTEKIVMLLGVPLYIFSIIMKPLIWVLSKSANGVFRILGGDPKNISSEDISEEELQTIVETHETLNDNEKQILTDVITASHSSISEVMRPRADVEFLQAQMLLDDASDYVQELPYSRFPVIGADFDDVLGFVHVRDLLDLKNRPEEATTVGDVVRPILKFPGTNQLFPSLTQMRAKGVHIAVVIDEYGGTDGICTMEDMIEELIGEIRDEYDLKRKPEIVKIKDGSMSVDAGISLEDFAELTGVELEQGQYETVAGYILSKLGEIAKVGDSVDVDDLTVINVTKVQGMRISRVKVKQKQENLAISEDA